MTCNVPCAQSCAGIVWVRTWCLVKEIEQFLKISVVKKNYFFKFWSKCLWKQINFCHLPLTFYASGLSTMTRNLEKIFHHHAFKSFLIKILDQSDQILNILLHCVKFL